MPFCLSLLSTTFYFPLISEAVTLCTLFWVLMLIEVVPERMCTWHVKEWVIDSRYKYFQCQGFVKSLLWKPAYWIPIIPFRFSVDRFPAPYLDSYMLIKENVAYFDKVGKITVFLTSNKIYNFSIIIKSGFVLLFFCLIVWIWWIAFSLCVFWLFLYCETNFYCWAGFNGNIFIICN